MLLIELEIIDQLSKRYYHILIKMLSIVLKYLSILTN